MTITFSAVILAGGQARRMGGVDKGLQLFRNQSLFEHIYQRLQPQIADIAINANRNQQRYAQSGLPVFSDDLAGFQGPLSGILTALQRAQSNFVLFVPCDCPFFPMDLFAKLKHAVISQHAQLAYAHDGEREHPTFCLVSTSLAPALAQYLATGERRMLTFMQQQHAIAVDFSATPDAFKNINNLVDLQT
ncbi:molybdenum cofactor guanylyltransferase MobA [Pasteurella multocida]|uniref:molybdenum cofactor guanylyltransferase MobA n=1 Tax=Pasteurella multocida TaxID=747 RepID=UPI0008FA45DF|nr:molybdenum cofactor guanylyltransferase MobA [Pasteurella multocida]MDC4234608.1 molybdenum cofactor guanylyltransferase MobA [Pasteurella multocida]OIQ14675.1 molybdenum cofactor guanylyltransferase [Pasteurella multocida subsp. multocida]PNW23783.1 molybdenum cofactor guanylyltransferase [Pasteurella multocida subsp. multocida]